MQEQVRVSVVLLEEDVEGWSTDRYDLEIYPVEPPMETMYQLSVSPITETEEPVDNPLITELSVPGAERTLTSDEAYSVADDP